MANIEEVTAKYIELRDRKAAIVKRQSEETQPLTEAMEAIESWLLAQMNGLGVDSFKTGAGTPYKANSNSVKLADAGAFKGHVFAPALQGIVDYLAATGHSLQEADRGAIEMILQDWPLWDMVDFRAGKKGVMDYVEHHSSLPPGIAMETFTVVNVRRS